MYKVLLLGTPEYVVSTFEVIRQNFEVVGVVTKPSKPQGRGFKIEPTPVAKWAVQNNIRVFAPTRIIHMLADLKALNFDIMLTFSYGEIIPQAVLNLGKFPPLNIHGSILPKYRGAAPVHHAVLNGDHEIGITLMQMVAALDAGPMFFVAKAPLSETMTTSEAIILIASLAEKNIVRWLGEIFLGRALAVPQPTPFTLSPKLDKAQSELKSTDSRWETLRKIRAFSLEPGAYTFIDGKRVKVFQAKTTLVNKAAPSFLCKDGRVYFSDYQFESKKRVKLLP